MNKNKLADKLTSPRRRLKAHILALSLRKLRGEKRETQIVLAVEKLPNWINLVEPL